MIHDIATIELADGKRAEFLDKFRQLVPKVREEEGCLEYGPTIDVATEIPAQESARENVATIVEKWESIEALKKHLVAPHMIDYRGTVKDLVVQMDLRILEPA